MDNFSPDERRILNKAQSEKEKDVYILQPRQVLRVRVHGKEILLLRNVAQEKGQLVVSILEGENLKQLKSIDLQELQANESPSFYKIYLRNTSFEEDEDEMVDLGGTVVKFSLPKEAVPEEMGQLKIDRTGRIEVKIPGSEVNIVE